MSIDTARTFCRCSSVKRPKYSPSVSALRSSPIHSTVPSPKSHTTVRYESCPLRHAFSSSPITSGISFPFRAKPRRTARCSIIHASSRLIRRSRRAPATPSSRSTSMAKHSNRMVNRPFGSAHDSRTCRTPCSVHEILGGRACSRVVYCIVSKCRHTRSSLWSYSGAWLAALGAPPPFLPMFDPHMHLPLFELQFHSLNSPRRAQSKQLPVQFRIAHSSSIFASRTRNLLLTHGKPARASILTLRSAFCVQSPKPAAASCRNPKSPQDVSSTARPCSRSEPLHYAWCMGPKFDSHPIGTDSPAGVRRLAAAAILGEGIERRTQNAESELRRGLILNSHSAFCVQSPKPAAASCRNPGAAACCRTPRSRLGVSSTT